MHFKEIIAIEPSRLNWLQSLRGISVVAVMLHHLTSANDAYFKNNGSVNFLYFGHCGVDIFFVISGFIMYHLYHRDWSRPEQFTSFIIRRFTRIYPIYWIITTAVLALALLLPGALKEYKLNPFYLIESYSLLPLGYSIGNPVIPAAWTLFHEMKFYIVFSGCILFQRSAIVLWIAGWIALTVLQTLWLLRPESLHQGVNFVFSPYNFEFLLGCIIAWYVSKKKPRLIVGILSGVSGVVVISAIAYFDNQRFLENTLAHILLYSIPSTLFVLAVAVMDTSSRFNSYTNRPIILLGDSSYSLYLIHYPVYAICSIVTIRLGLSSHLPMWMIFLLMISISTVISLFFHARIERPLINILKAKAA